MASETEIIVALMIVLILAAMFIYDGIVTTREEHRKRGRQLHFHQLYKRWPYDDEELADHTRRFKL